MNKSKASLELLRGPRVVEEVFGVQKVIRCATAVSLPQATSKKEGLKLWC